MAKPKEAYSWMRILTKGHMPTQICAHSATYCQGKLFIFGGWNGTSMVNELYYYTPETMTWTKAITKGKTPGNRAGHTATCVGSKIYVFGGSDGSNYLNDLYILDTNTMEWSQAYVAGLSPAARSRHSCTLIGNNKLIVLGGGDDSRVYCDLYILDIETNTWSKPDISGVQPSCRWGHSSVCYNDKMYIFGGHNGTTMLSDFYSFDIETMSWSEIHLKGSVPSPRAGHSIEIINNKLILFAGGDGKRLYSDLFIMEMENIGLFQQITASGEKPSPRWAHSLTNCNEKLFVFAGGDDYKQFTDLYLISIDQEISKKKKKRQKRGNSVLLSDSDRPKLDDITTWLQSLGLSKYTESFLREEITIDMLPYLTEEHFTQLGVQTIGARLQMKASIEQIKSETPPHTPLRSSTNTSLRNSGNSLSNSAALNNNNNQHSNNHLVNNQNNNTHNFQSQIMINSVNTTLQMQSLKNSIDSMAEAIKSLTLTQMELLQTYKRNVLFPQHLQHYFSFDNNHNGISLTDHDNANDNNTNSLDYLHHQLYSNYNHDHLNDDSIN